MNFDLTCCGRGRGIFPGDVLVCSKCDYTEASSMPNENQAKDPPRGWKPPWQ